LTNRAGEGIFEQLQQLCCRVVVVVAPLEPVRRRLSSCHGGRVEAPSEGRRPVMRFTRDFEPRRRSEREGQRVSRGKQDHGAIPPRTMPALGSGWLVTMCAAQRRHGQRWLSQELPGPSEEVVPVRGRSPSVASPALNVRGNVASQDACRFRQVARRSRAKARATKGKTSVETENPRSQKRGTLFC
jgi:hypothetical protein